MLLHQFDRISSLRDTRLEALIGQALKQVEVAAEKVVAHQADPRTFPLPAEPRSLERVLAKRFERLTPGQRAAASARLLPQAKAAKAVRRRLHRELAEVDLRSSTSVVQQARAIRGLGVPRLSLETLGDLVREAGLLGRPRPSATGPSELGHLELRIHKVACLDDTREGGKDEISLGGVLMDLNTLNTRPQPAVEIGKFKTGDVKTLANPLRFPAFDLRESGTTFPKNFAVILAMAEVDGGGFVEFLDAFVDSVDDALIGLIATALGITIAEAVTSGALAGSLAGPLGAIVGALAGAIVGLAIVLLKRLWGDEVFEPQATLPISIGSLTQRFAGGAADTPEEVAVFFGFGGHYEVTYDWRLFA